MKNIANFNYALKTLTGIVVAKNPADVELLKLQSEINIVINYSELDPIMLTGKYILKYHKEISSKNDTFFLAESYDDDIPKHSQKDTVSDIIPRLKSTYIQSHAEEKAIIWTNVKKMLTELCKFIRDNDLGITKQDIICFNRV